MPLIPLPVRSNPFPNAPAPALDRERRPTVDNSGLSQAVGNLAKAGKQPELPDSLAAPSAGLVAIGRAVAQGGDLITGLAIKRQEAQSIAQESEWDNRMSMEYARVMADAQRNPTLDLEAEVGNRVTALRKEFAEDKTLNPGARQQIELRLNRWAGQSAAGAMEYAARRDFARAKSALVATMDNAAEGQDRPRFDAAKETALANGYLYPHEGEAFDQKFIQRGKQLKREAKADTFDAVLNSAVAFARENGAEVTIRNVLGNAWGPVDASDQERINEAVRGVEKQAKTDVAAGIVNGIASGEIKSEAKLDEIKEKNPSWKFPPALEEQMRDILRNENREQVNEDRAKNGVPNFVKLYDEIRSLDPKKDPDRVKFATLLHRINTSVAPGMEGELREELKKKYGLLEKETHVRPEIQQSISKTLANIFSKNGAIPYENFVPEVVRDEHGKPRLKNGSPVLVRDKNGTVKGRYEEDPKAKQRAIDAQAEIETKMRDWFNANPEEAKSLKAVTKKFYELLPEGTRGGALDSLIKAAPKAPVKDSALPFGNPLLDRDNIDETNDLLPPVGALP